MNVNNKALEVFYDEIEYVENDQIKMSEMIIRTRQNICNLNNLAINIDNATKCYKALNHDLTILKKINYIT
jgi:hypothetical protein